MSKLAILTVLFAIVPVSAFAQDAATTSSPTKRTLESDVAESLGTWTLDELCERPARPEIAAELKRRDLFSRRELRAIQEETVRTRIRAEAVICIMGEPDKKIPASTSSDRDWVDAWTYPVNEAEVLIVHMRLREDETTVVRAYTDEADNLDVTKPYWSERCVGPVFGCRERAYPAGMPDTTVSEPDYY